MRRFRTRTTTAAIVASIALIGAACDTADEAEGPGAVDTETPVETETVETETPTAPATEGTETETPAEGAAGEPLGTIAATDQEGAGTIVTVEEVSLEGVDQGWVVIHRSDDGAAGEVLGWAPIDRGTTTNVEVNLETPITEDQQLIPMLHVDDNTIGGYEFGEVEGADAPVIGPDGSPVTAQLEYRVEAGG